MRNEHCGRRRDPLRQQVLGGSPSTENVTHLSGMLGTRNDKASLLRFGSLFPEYLKRKHLSILSRVSNGHDFHIVRIEL